MTDAVTAVAQPAIAYYIERVKRKLAAGVYQTAPAACFCGDLNGQAVRTVDRYGLPHRMCFCSKCGLLYASPRMTPESLERFYRDDYRAIYDAGMTEEHQADLRAQAREDGDHLHGVIRDYDLNPSVVFELGCNEGAMLDAFLEAGCTCLGVDYDDGQVQTGLLAGRPVVRGGIEALELFGRKADLIIASHVLEHVHDLESTLMRLKALLTPTGMLYIALPSLFTGDPALLYQNAHTYQFSARTLSYVLECCGFEDVMLTEGIASLWRASDEIREKDMPDGPEVYRIAKYLNGGKNILPMIRTVNKFERADRERHLKAAVASGRPNIHPLIGTHAGRDAVILGGGPSIDGEIQTIANLKDGGAVLYAIERMLPWCMANGLLPDYVVAMDAHEDVTEALTRLPEEITYLVAMQCHPTVLETLKDRTVYTFATPQKDIRQRELFESAGIDWTQVNAGGSVTICAMSLALMLGSRQIHMFGFDCQFTEQPYARGIAGVGAIEHAITIEIDGYPDRTFHTTLPYLAFAQQFLELIELCRRVGHIDWAKVYGDSLVKYIAKPSPVLVREGA